MNKRKIIFIVVNALVILLGVLILAGVAVIGINGYVILSQKDRIYDSPTEAVVDGELDCVVVLGAGLKADGTPNHMLEDRIKVGVEVLRLTGAKYILMSGDRSDEYYDEPGAMKRYAEEMGVDPSQILIDNNGFSTLESITRAKEEYGFDRVVVITQKYHLYRALYIAEDCGIEAIGVSADLRSYRKQLIYDLRELLARVKDFFVCI